MVKPITSFRGEHYFLSNYHTQAFTWRGVEFQSGEQAFAYAKTFFADHDVEFWRQTIMDSKTPGEAKKVGRNRVMNLDVKTWDMRKVQYMREIVHAKFKAPGLAGKLINTGSAMLVEGNDWGDKFWGRCIDKSTGKMVGLNQLGTILMEERGYWLYSNFDDVE